MKNVIIRNTLEQTLNYKVESIVCIGVVRS